MGDQSQADPAADADDGVGGDPSQGQDNGLGSRSQSVSVLVGEPGNYEAESGLGRGHHLRALLCGFMYLVAILDWFSRYVVTWRLSNSLDEIFCVDALEDALTLGRPEIFNTDQGVQFTGSAFVGRLELAGVAVSMDGRGRALDNVFVERLWRTVKYEEIYLWRHETVPALASGLTRYFRYYNRERRHQSLDDRTPAEVYGKGSRSRKRRGAFSEA